MKNFIIRTILPTLLDTVFDIIIAALKKRVQNTKSKVDDKIVDVLQEEGDELKEDVIELIKKL